MATNTSKTLQCTTAAALADAYVIFLKNVPDMTERTKLFDLLNDLQYLETVSTDEIVCFESALALVGVEQLSGELVGASLQSFVPESTCSSTAARRSDIRRLSGSSFTDDEPDSRSEAVGQLVTAKLQTTLSEICGNRCRKLRLRVSESQAPGLLRNKLKFEEVFTVGSSLFSTHTLSAYASIYFSVCHEDESLCLKLLFLKGEIEGAPDKVLSCMRVTFAAEVAGEFLQLHCYPRTTGVRIRIIEEARSTEDYVLFPRRQAVDMQLSPTASLNLSTATPSLNLGSLNLSSGNKELYALRHRDEILPVITLDRSIRHVRREDIQYTVELRRDYANTWFTNGVAQQMNVEYSNDTNPVLLLAKIPEDIQVRTEHLRITVSVEFDVSQVQVGQKSIRQVLAEAKRKRTTYRFNKYYLLCGEE